MRQHPWKYKMITTYSDGVTASEYFTSWDNVKMYKQGTLEHETAKFQIFPYGGVIK